MRILIVCQYFWPENFRINDVAVSLRERGHEVTVLTGKPNYPKGEYFEGYSLFGQWSEQYNGVNVLRVPVITRGRNSLIRLALNYASFMVSGSLLAPFRARQQYDVILVYALSPIMQAFPALTLKALGRGPVHIWLLDLWPESLSAVGAVEGGWVLRLMRAVTGIIHRAADLNLVSSAGFTEKLQLMGVSPRRIRYLPNFAESIYEQALRPGEAAMGSARSLPSGFRVMFAGNIGDAQDFSTILSAAALLKAKKHIHFIIVGDGRALPWVKKEASGRGLEDTFHLVGRFPLQEMPSWFARADVMLVTLRKDEVLALTVPGKIHSYMAAAKPMIAALDGEPARVVNESQCGICVPAGDAVALARAIDAASQMSADQLERLGANGKQYFKAHFERHQVIRTLEGWLQPSGSGP